MIADPARSRFGGVVVADRLTVFPRILLASPREIDIADLMIENYYLLGASRRLEQALDLGILGSLHLVLIIEVNNRGLLMNKLESLPVQGKIINYLSRIIDMNCMRDKVPRSPGGSRGRVVSVIDRPLGRLSYVVFRVASTPASI